MGHLFKHVAVRSWTALMLGGLASLIALPPFAGSLGPSWMIGPAVGLILVAYWLIGSLFAHAGRRRLERLLEEVRVWERAGMEREARQALCRAEAVVDSFLFSPFTRRKPARRLLARKARFQMAQGHPRSSSDPVVVAYLRQHPQDRGVAVQWLQAMSSDRADASAVHDIAVRIGRAHPDDPTIQRLLAQVYLSQRRCDFVALHTYGQMVDSDAALPEGMIDELAGLFVSERRVDPLALKVYLAAHAGGRSGDRLLAGIAACCRDIPSGPLTRSLLIKGGDVLGGLDPSRRADLAGQFLSPADDAIQDMAEGKRRSRRLGIGPFFRRGRAAMVDLGARIMRMAAGIGSAVCSRRGRFTAKWVGMGLAALAVCWLAVSTAIYLAATFKTVEPVPKTETHTITDPFTLQVAAYLKEADARRYADQLIDRGLDAYWTRAVGTQKTWYQVRISHFKTKAEARAAGEDLKSRHLIGDYYVANYKRPDIP